MSLKNSYVTSDYLEWDSMLSLVRKLYRDQEYRLSLLIGCGSFFGLRISDLLTLTWSMLLDNEKFVITEQKTGKRREIRVNCNFQKHIADCYKSLGVVDKNEKCFLSRKRTVYSTQRINVLFKSMKSKYNLKIEHFSTHSMRKTFGRQPDVSEIPECDADGREPSRTRRLSAGQCRRTVAVVQHAA